MPVLLTSDEHAEAWLGTEPLSAKYVGLLLASMLVYNQYTVYVQHTHSAFVAFNVQWHAISSGNGVYIYPACVELPVNAQAAKLSTHAAEAFAVLHRTFNDISLPYNGEDLVWHPVTPSMSSMSYQSPDASQNMELKRGNIASFFKTGVSAKTAKATVRSEPHASTQADQGAGAVKADVTDGDHAGLSAASANPANQLATGTHGHQGNHDKFQEGGTGQGEFSQPQSSHQSAGLPTKPEVIGPADNNVRMEESAEGDVLNTDDAGGIGALYLLHVSACILRSFSCKLQGGGFKVPILHGLSCSSTCHHKIRCRHT